MEALAVLLIVVLAVAGAALAAWRRYRGPPRG